MDLWRLCTVRGRDIHPWFYTGVHGAFWETPADTYSFVWGIQGQHRVVSPCCLPQVGGLFTTMLTFGLSQRRIDKGNALGAELNRIVLCGHGDRLHG